MEGLAVLRFASEVGRFLSLALGNSLGGHALAQIEKGDDLAVDLEGLAVGGDVDLVVMQSVSRMTHHKSGRERRQQTPKRQT